MKKKKIASENGEIGYCLRKKRQVKKKKKKEDKVKKKGDRDKK